MNDLKLNIIYRWSKLKESNQDFSILGSEEAAKKILVENPEVNAATFFNLLKQSNILKSTVVFDSKSEESKKKTSLMNASILASRWAECKKKNESDSLSSNVQVAKESKTFLRAGFKFLEKNSEIPREIVGPTRFHVILIEEGLGNLRDGFYYTKEALKSAIPLFEGKKIFADHPTLSEEEERPERSVRDVVGHFENVRYSETEDGRGFLEAEAVVLPDESYRWARSLMRHAVEYSSKYPDKNFIGLSINAGGSAESVMLEEFLKTYPIPDSAKRKLEDALRERDEIRVVSKIESATSCDLVTEAGAGGKVLKILEGKKNGSRKKRDS